MSQLLQGTPASMESQIELFRQHWDNVAQQVKLSRTMSSETKAIVQGQVILGKAIAAVWRTVQEIKVTHVDAKAGG